MRCYTCEQYDRMGFGYACPCVHINGRCTTMMPPTKDQTDIGLDNPTVDASDQDQGGPDGNKDMADQSSKDEADINYMLSRFGVTPPRGAPPFGEWDDTIDLQTAIESVREARQGYNTLPQELRAKFPSMEDFLTAVDRGQLVLKPEEAPTLKSVPVADATGTT